jgi:hypothetical protein
MSPSESGFSELLDCLAGLLGDVGVYFLNPGSEPEEQADVTGVVNLPGDAPGGSVDGVYRVVLEDFPFESHFFQTGLDIGVGLFLFEGAKVKFDGDALFKLLDA